MHLSLSALVFGPLIRQHVFLVCINYSPPPEASVSPESEAVGDEVGLRVLEKLAAGSIRDEISGPLDAH
jgi:hypothetical protein